MAESSSSSSSSSSTSRYKIGYALAPKKIESFIQQSLLDHAKQRGIDLIKIDSTTPLVKQGPFDCIIHKMSGEDWTKQLEEFSGKYPTVSVIDHPDSIEKLHNRITMLDAVSELKIECGNDSFGIPKQIVVYDERTLFDPTLWNEGLNFPVIAKPLVADGSAKSHNMSLVFNRDSLKKLKAPVVLQEFVNHGGVIFKVYVAGDYVKCVKRKSLPDISVEKLETLEGLMSFSQISNLTTQERNDGKYYKMMDLDATEMPPEKLVAEIALGLRKVMNLNLFNFDLIRDSRYGNRYLVIDINYFPGYAKMPMYENVFTDFLWDLVHKKGVIPQS